MERIHARRSGALLLAAAAAVATAALSCVSTGVAAAAAQATVSKASCMAAADALVKEASAPLHYAAPTQTVNLAKVQGDTLYDISPDLSNQLQSQVAAGAKAAASAAGMSLTAWDGKNAVSTENQGMTEAVAQGAKGIILQSVTPSLISGPFAKAKAAKIPIVNWDDDDPAAALNGESARVTSDFSSDGRAMAAYILSHSDCDTHVLILYPAAFPNNVDIYKGVANEIKSLCTKCQVTATAINPSTAATTVGPLVQTDIRRDPDLKWVVPTYDYLATFVVPAIQQMGGAGSQVHVVSHDGNPANLAYIRKGEVQVADITFPEAQYQGWVLVDQTLRLMAGQKPAEDVVPTQLVDSANLPKTNSQLFAKFGNYRTAFKKLWKK